MIRGRASSIYYFFELYLVRADLMMSRMRRAEAPHRNLSGLSACACCADGRGPAGPPRHETYYTVVASWRAGGGLGPLSGTEPSLAGRARAYVMLGEGTPRQNCATAPVASCLVLCNSNRRHAPVSVAAFYTKRKKKIRRFRSSGLPCRATRTA